MSPERWSLPIALTYAAMLPMIWLTGFDTGVVFWRRSDFVDLGGYDESRLAAEDVHFLWRLTRMGKGRGQRLLRLRGVKAVTSTRKFDQYGDWHYLRQMGVPPAGWERSFREAARHYLHRILRERGEADGSSQADGHATE